MERESPGRTLVIHRTLRAKKTSASGCAYRLLLCEISRYNRYPIGSDFRIRFEYIRRQKYNEIFTTRSGVRSKSLRKKCGRSNLQSRSFSTSNQSTTRHTSIFESKRSALSQPDYRVPCPRRYAGVGMRIFEQTWPRRNTAVARAPTILNNCSALRSAAQAVSQSRVRLQPAWLPGLGGGCRGKKFSCHLGSQAIVVVQAAEPLRHFLL